MWGIPLLNMPKLNRALTKHSHVTHLFIVLSRSLISSQCLSTELFKTSTCIFILSASSLCLSASKRHSDSHLNLFSRKQEYWEQSAQGTKSLSFVVPCLGVWWRQYWYVFSGIFFLQPHEPLIFSSEFQYFLGLTDCKAWIWSSWIPWCYAWVYPRSLNRPRELDSSAW